MHVFPGFVTPYIQKLKLLSPTENLSEVLNTSPHSPSKLIALISFREYQNI